MTNTSRYRCSHARDTDPCESIILCVQQVIATWLKLEQPSSPHPEGELRWSRPPSSHFGHTTCNQAADKRATPQYSLDQQFPPPSRGVSGQCPCAGKMDEPAIGGGLWMGMSWSIMCNHRKLEAETSSCDLQMCLFPRIVPM